MDWHSIFPGPLDFDILNRFRSQFMGDFAVGLIGRTEFTELSSLLELPLDIDMPPKFSRKVGGYVASRTRRRLRLMETLTKDVVSPVEHIGHLQRLRVSQQTAWEVRESIDNLMRTEAVTDEITTSRKEQLTWSWFNRWSLSEL